MMNHLQSSNLAFKFSLRRYNMAASMSMSMGQSMFMAQP
jgi:hypothetical protein